MANNEKFRLLLRVAFWITPILIGTALAVGAYREKFSNICARVDAVELKTEKAKGERNLNKMSIVGIEKDITHIKETLDRIENKIDGRR